MSNLVWMQTVKYSAVTWLQALQERDLTLCGDTIHFCVKTSDDWKRGSDSFVGLLESAKWKTGPRCGIQRHRKSKWASRLVSVITNMKETLISPNWNEFFFFFFFLFEGCISGLCTLSLGLGSSCRSSVVSVCAADVFNPLEWAQNSWVFLIDSSQDGASPGLKDLLKRR